MSPRNWRRLERLIEVELAGLAAERATAEDLKPIGRYVEAMEATLSNHRPFRNQMSNFTLRSAERRTIAFF